MTRSRKDALHNGRKQIRAGVVLPLKVLMSFGSYVIRDASGENVAKGYSSRSAAETRAAEIADEIAAAARRKKRPCITCGVEMVSTGPGHCMCDACRRNPDRATGLRITPQERKALGLGPSVNGGSIPEGW